MAAAVKRELMQSILRRTISLYLHMHKYVLYVSVCTYVRTFCMCAAVPMAMTSSREEQAKKSLELERWSIRIAANLICKSLLFYFIPPLFTYPQIHRRMASLFARAFRRMRLRVQVCSIQTALTRCWKFTFRSHCHCWIKPFLIFVCSSFLLLFVCCVTFSYSFRKCILVAFEITLKNVHSKQSKTLVESLSASPVLLTPSYDLISLAHIIKLTKMCLFFITTHFSPFRSFVPPHRNREVMNTVSHCPLIDTLTS